MRSPVLLTTLALLAGPRLCSSADAPLELAVVVHKSTALTSIPYAELRSMILGEKTKWSDGKKVTPVQTPPDSAETALLLKTVFKMSEAVLKRYYMYSSFTGKEIAPPKEVASAGALKQFVATTPGAIGCVLASAVDDTVKVLKVDGAGPGDHGYTLH